MAESRVKSLDILRAAAIIMVVLAHLPGYALGLGLGPLEVYLVTLGLGIFVFVSGYALRLAHPRVRTSQDIGRFVRRRALRVYTLYLPALLIFVVLFSILEVYHRFDLSPFWMKLAIHFVGAQELMAPRFAPLPTLWFVGLILLYYLLYLIVMRFGGSPSRILLASAVTLALCIVVRSALGLIGNRFFVYYPAFVAGVLAGCMWGPSGAYIPKGVAAVSAIMMAVSAILLWPLKEKVYDSADRLLGAVLYGDGLRFVFLGSGILTSVFLAEWWQRRVSPRAFRIVLGISAASYAIYLFHRPILSLLVSSLKHAVNPGQAAVDCMAIIVGLPLVCVVAYAIQRVEKRITQRLTGTTPVLASEGK